MLIFLVGKFSFGQYPINQSIGSDSTLVTSKGGLKGRIVVYSYADTTAANLERIRQYAGAMIFTTGANKLWYRNSAASAWVELGSSAGGVNIYNSDGILTGDRSLYGDNRNLDFTDIGTFTMNADRVSLNTYNSALVSLQDSSVRISGDTIALNALNQNIVTILKDSSRSLKRISYMSNLGSTFTRHTLVDKNYVDSLQNIIPTLQQVLTAGSILTTNNTINYGGNDFKLRGDSIVLLAADGTERLRLIPVDDGAPGGASQITFINADEAKMTIQSGDQYLETTTGWFIRNTVGVNSSLSVNGSSLSGGSPQVAPLVEVIQGAETLFELSNDSFSLRPPGGKIYIDSLRTLAAGDDEMMTWNPRTGVVSHQAIPSGNSSGSSNGTVTPEQSSSVVYNSGSYNAFNSIAWDRSNPDTIVNTWKNSGNHAADGYIMWNYTTDGFASFTTADTLRVDGSNLSASVIMVGKGNGGRWVYSYGVNGDYDTIYFAKSDAISNEVTSAGIIRAATSGVGYDWLFPFGKTIKMNGDTLYMPGYGLRTGQTQTEAVYFKTYDNGNTWSFGGVIVANATFGSSTPSETDWEIYEQGATVATTKIVAIVRDDFYKARHLQMISTDGGATWTNLFLTQGDFAFHDVNSGAIVAESWPCMILKEGQYLYAVHGIRNTLANGGFSFRVFKTKDPTSINTWEGGVTTPKFSTSYRALGFYKNDPIDWGYGWPYITPNKRLRTIFYDVAAKWTTNGSVPENVEIKTISLLGNNTYEAYNDADQSISTGTETTVLFPDPWLDSENFYNSDSTKIFIPSDGYYEINAFVQIDTSALGTYRKFQLKALDGAIYGGAGTSIYATYLLDKAIIQPSTNSEFNYVHLKSGKELKAGMWVVVTVTQDAGISLNIKNTVVNAGSDGARIILKKIN